MGMAVIQARGEKGLDQEDGTDRKRQERTREAFDRKHQKSLMMAEE